jgi:hypothetical protein
VPSFVAPASVTDPSVIDALPSAADDAFDPPAPAEGDDLDASGVGGPRRGLFGR